MPSETKTKTTAATSTEMARVYTSRHYLDTMYARGQWHKYLNGVWNPYHDRAMDKEMWELMEEYEGQGRCNPTISKFSAIEKCTKARLWVPDDAVDQYTNLVNLQSGVYSLEDSSIYPHKESYYFTTQLPFAYDPSATCTMWHMYLQTTFVRPDSTQQDKELIEFIQEAIGYSLTTDVSHHVTFWCYGGGSNGKGVLFHVLEQLAGTSFFPLNIGLLNRNPYQLAELAGKRVAACSESNATGNLVDDAQIKALVAGDTMMARSPHRRPFTLHPKVKLWWSMNDLPSVADYSEGFWRRVRVIPFNREFKGRERILDLKKKLNQELPGIFNWAMEGLRRLRNRGHFAEPPQIRDVTSKYRHESNPIALFIEDECKNDVEDLIHCTQVTEAYRLYKMWCKDNGYRYRASRNFRREMERIGHRVRLNGSKTHQKQVFSGIKCKNSLETLPY